MPNQYQIEQMAGITSVDVAQHIMKGETPSAKNAMSLLKMQCSCYEDSGMALLKEAVLDCKREVEKANG